MNNVENEFIGIIYKYTSPSNKCYVGQTVNEKNRKRQHRQSAYNENDKAYNHKFHVAIRKYGWDSFKYEVLLTIIEDSEEALTDRLNEEEAYYIKLYDSFKNGYNMTPGGNQVRGKDHPSYGTHLSEEHKEKLKNSVRKQVSQYDLDGNYLATYKSAADAQKITGCDSSQITAICRGKAYTSKGFQWRYGDSKENIGKPNVPKNNRGTGRTGKLNGRSKEIYQYSLQGELINIWEGALCAEREGGYSSTHLSKSIKKEVPYGKKGELKSFWSFVPLSVYDVKLKVAIWNENSSRKYKKCYITPLDELLKDAPEPKSE